MKFFFFFLPFMVTIPFLFFIFFHFPLIVFMAIKIIKTSVEVKLIDDQKGLIKQTETNNTMLNSQDKEVIKSKIYSYWSIPTALFFFFLVRN